MSSEQSGSSSSSRLSQFGLYRSIDARTEEFLRLSRKRQIRQGCACAAVSTAITVTVVVTVLLVYEYGINLNPKTDQKQSKKQNWFGLFNDSTAFDSKLNKGKLNFDPSTLKLLPLLLKTLNHNKFLEKVLDDSSSNPIITKKSAIDSKFNKNSYNTKNKIVNPNSNFRTLQLQKDNLNYFMQARKMRDNQRVIKYFDKMIAERPVTKLPVTIDNIDNDDVTDIMEVENGDKNDFIFEVITNYQTTKSTRPETTTTRSRKSTKIAKKLNPIETISKEVNTSASQHRGTLKNDCKCHSYVNTLLGKLISAFQELLPEIMIAKSRCSEKDNITILPLNHTRNSEQENITDIRLRTTKNPKRLIKTPPTTTEPTEMATISNKWYYTYAIKKTTTEKSVENILFHDLLMHDDEIRKYLNTNIFSNNTIANSESKGNEENIDTIIPNQHIITTVKSFIDPPLTGKYLKPDTTVPMNLLPRTKRTTSKTTSHVTSTKPIETTVKPKNTSVSSKEITFKSFLNLARQFREDLKKHDKKDKETIAIVDKSEAVNVYPDVNINDLKLFSLKRIGDLMIPSKITTQKEFLISITPSTTEKHSTDLSKTVKIYSNHINTTEDQPVKKEIQGEEEEKRVTPDGDIQVQEILKQVENIMKTPSYNKYSPTGLNMIDDDPKPVEIHGKKNENKLNKDKKDYWEGEFNSMLPESRPTYLEINRHPDFKFGSSNDEYQIRNAYS